MKRNWIRTTAVMSAVAAASLLLISCAGNPQKAKLKYLNKGQAFMKQQQYSSAAIEFRNALKVDPKYVDAYYELAKADLAMRDGNGAYKALGQAINLDPNRVDLRLERGRLLLYGRAYAPATDDVNYVLKEDPQNAEAHRVLGSIEIAQKQYPQALQEFSKASSLAPNDATSYLDLALANMALRNEADAELNLKKAVQVDPKSIPAYTDLANFYRLQKKPEQAEQALEEGIKANPTAVPLYLNLATVLESESKRADAENTLTSLSNQLPKSADAAVGIGDFYLQAKMNDRALAEYQRGLSNDPKNIVLQERIEDVYLTTGRNDEAAKIDDQLRKDAPNDVTAGIDHGRVLAAEGKLSDAIQTLQKLVADFGDSAQAHYYLAMAYWQNNDLGQANGQLQDTLRVSPSLPIALTALVNLNFTQQKYSVAQLYAQELVQKTPDDPHAHLMFGQILLKLGQLKQAGDQFVAAQKLAPNDPTMHTSLAAWDAAEKRFPEAESEYKAAMQADPRNVSVLGDYANFLLLQKQPQKASALVSQFLTQNPDQPDAHLLMGQIDILAKNLPAAMAETQKSLQIKPNSENAYLQMGQIYRDQGNSSAAIQAYTQGMTYGHPSAPIVTVIGNMYMEQGDLTKASDQFQKALLIDPNFSVAANNLAWIYAQQGQHLDVALGLAQKAKAQQPEAVSFSDTLAWVMFRKGDYAGALPLLQDCVKKSPESAQFHYHLGMVLVADGQKTEGKAQLQAALHMNLDSEDAQQARKALAQ